jgi:manganese/zinc/iron transport system permease protein
MSVKLLARMQIMAQRAQKRDTASSVPEAIETETAMRSERSSTWLLIGLLILAVPITAAALNISYDYTLRTVAFGGAILGVVSGVLGCFLVLRQQSLLGDALSHAALPGVALAFLVAGKQLGVLLIGAGIAGWLGAMFISAVLRTTRIKQDTAMGITLAAWFAFGLALMGYIQSRPDASQAGLKNFIFGQAAAIVGEDVLLIGGVGCAAFAVLALFWKEFKLITFDPEFAATNGYPTRLLDVLLTSLTVIAIVLGLQMAGVVLMVGLLIAPAVAARQWTRGLGQMIALSAVFGAFSGASGAILSAVSTGMPTGPLIIVVATLIVFVSIMVAPERGVLWKRLRDRRNRKAFGKMRMEGAGAWNSLKD